MRVFTEEELKKYDGSNGVSYIAYDGKVYDVSTSYHWREGKHHATHYAGYDLTDAAEQAPHDTSWLEKYPIVGELIK